MVLVAVDYARHEARGRDMNSTASGVPPSVECEPCAYFGALLVVPIVVACFLAVCLVGICCNIGGVLDCVYEGHRRALERRKQASVVQHDPLSEVSLLSPPSSRSIERERALSPVRSPSSSFKSVLVESSRPSILGKYQKTRPFASPSGTPSLLR